MARNVRTPPSSVFAEEGTAAHALGELLARHHLVGPVTNLDRLTGKWHDKYGHAVSDLETMQAHARDYVELLRDKLAEHPNSVLLLEQRVPTGVPSCWGTADAVIVSPIHVEIIDLKYGQGVRVEVKDNPQLKLYGVGALEAFDDLLGEAEFVRITVHQPRLNNTNSQDIPADELRVWRDSLIPIAEAALGHDAPFGPSDEACRWCPASGQCQAQLQYATALDFGTEPEVLTEEDLAAALDRIPAIEAWCSAVRNHALDVAYSKGKTIPGYKVVRSGGKRFVRDQEAALAALTQIGYTLDEISKRKINGIGELEKLLGGDFEIAVGPFVSKSDGSPSLVTEDDRRPSIQPNPEAAKDFEEEA